MFLRVAIENLDTQCSRKVDRVLDQIRQWFFMSLQNSSSSGKEGPEVNNLAGNNMGGDSFITQSIIFIVLFIWACLALLPFFHLHDYDLGILALLLLLLLADALTFDCRPQLFFRCC